MNETPQTPSRPLREKLGLEDELATLLFKVPPEVIEALEPLPRVVHNRPSGVAVYEFILAFIVTPDEIPELYAKIDGRLGTTGSLWVAWRKQRRGFTPQFGFEEVQRGGLMAGLIDVKICSVNDEWTAVKFVYRVQDR